MVERFTPEDGAEELTDAYALTLVPRFDLPPLPSQGTCPIWVPFDGTNNPLPEYIFVVDRSGSMGGAKMAAVKSSLQVSQILLTFMQ